MLQSLAVPGWLWARQPLAGFFRNSREARLAVSGCPALRFPARADFGGGAQAGLWAQRPGSAGVVVSGLGLTAERGPVPQSYLGPHGGGLMGVDTRSGHHRLPPSVGSRAALPASLNARAL